MFKYLSFKLCFHYYTTTTIMMSIISLFIFLLISTMTSTSSCQLDLIRRLLGPTQIHGMLYCAIDGSVIYGQMIPTFPNAEVQMQCGAGTVVSSVKTDATGNFSILIDAPRLMLPFLLTNCTLVVTTPLFDCNAELPSFGVLVSPLQLIGNTFHGLFNVTNFIPVGFRFVNNI
uniref:Phylloplanin-like n=2 Tax=Cucumis melo TaxID=3656 RepID=A0A9I9ELZ0_CUCME